MESLPPPPPPSRHLPPPPPPPSRLPSVRPFNVYAQQPHNDYRNELNDRPEIRHNKRVCVVNGYKAVETDYRREEDRFEDLRKRYAGNYNGFRQIHDVSRYGVQHNRPLEDPYRHSVPSWNGGGNGHLVHHRHDGRYGGEEPMPVGHLVHHRHDGRYGGEEPMPVGSWRDYGRRTDLPEPMPVGPWRDYGRRTDLPEPMPVGPWRDYGRRTDLPEPMPVGLWRDYGRRIDLPPPPPPPQPPLPYGRVNYETFGPPQPYFGRRSFY
ncbi:unnamed protein product [Microthlaspi erraticum]|uniref:Uncharacterized protein n=1 Tax=Microthlaspi erraticum TaxID=1685480 RepID=A0A6D2JPT2_9BRAS|nr:unnamed protein product [Microthlaspi erraticum]